MVVLLCGKTAGLILKKHEKCSLSFVNQKGVVGPCLWIIPHLWIRSLTFNRHSTQRSPCTNTQRAPEQLDEMQTQSL